MKRKDFSQLNIDVKTEKNSIFNHENYVAGIAPNLRGSNPTMYLQKPWEIRSNTCFSTVKEGNAFYKKNLAAGQKELAVEFDLATQQNFDFNYKHTQRAVKKTGVVIDSVEDMKVLFNQIPLDKTPISITINGAILPILAFYIVTALEQGVDLKLLTGTIQNNILKEFIGCNTSIYPPSPSIKIIADIFEYTRNNMPKFNSTSTFGYHVQKAGLPPEIELAYTLADGLDYLKTGISNGINIDSFAPRFSFFWAIGMDHFSEISKMRAARMIWAKIVKQFNPKNPKSLALHIHSKTNGLNLTEQYSFNNVTQTTIKAMAAAFGGTQSLQTNSLEAIALPSDFTARIARNTQLYIQEETKITQTVDPWAGSFLVEKRTEEIATKAWELLQEVEKLGGMTKAIEKGIPKMRIEEATLKKLASIDNNKDTNIELNNPTLEKEKELPFLEIDTTVRDSQITRLNELKTIRNSKEVKISLKNLTECTKTNNGNLLELAVEAAKKRATLSEILDALGEIRKI